MSETNFEDFRAYRKQSGKPIPEKREPQTPREKLEKFRTDIILEQQAKQGTDEQ